MLVVVLKRIKRTAALKKAVAVRVLVDKSRYLQRLTIGYRTPNPFALAGEHLQPVDLVNVRADFVHLGMEQVAEQIDAAHRAQAEMVDGDTCENRQFGVDNRRLSGAQREAKGAGDARRVEQSVNDQSIGGERRLFDPHRAKKRKFLALRISGVNRQAARRDPERLTAGLGAKEARPLIDRHFLKTLASDGARNSKARKADVGRVGRRLQFAEIEGGAIIGEPSPRAILDDIDVHWRGENKAAMQRLQGESNIVAAPQRRTGPRPDRNILVIGQVGERFRQGRFWRLERGLGELARRFDYSVGGEGRRRRGRRRRIRGLRGARQLWADSRQGAHNGEL